MDCVDSEPKVFAALNEIESATQGARLSISLKSSARTNKEGLVRARVEFSSSTSVLTAGAAVVSFCTSSESMLGAGVIQTGLINGGAIALKQSVVKKVTLKNAMKCAAPQVACPVEYYIRVAGTNYDLAAPFGEIDSSAKGKAKICFERSVTNPAGPTNLCTCVEVGFIESQKLCQN